MSEQPPSPECAPDPILVTEDIEFGSKRMAITLQGLIILSSVRLNSVYYSGGYYDSNTKRLVLFRFSNEKFPTVIYQF